MNGQQGEVAVRRGGGYLAASIGTLAGGTVGVAVGRIVGMPLAERAAGQVPAGSQAEGLQGILEAAGTGLGTAMLGIFVFVVAVLMTAWMGTVAGCGVALRLSGNKQAGQTALLTGCLGPPAVLAVAWVAQALYRRAAGAETYPLFAVAAVLAASTGRMLALRRRDPRPAHGPQRPPRPSGEDGRVRGG